MRKRKRCLALKGPSMSERTTGGTSLRVWETGTAAPTWEDGLISGSGSVGALIFGPPGEQTVSLAHERFFLPANRKPKAPLIAPVLDRVREAVLGGDGAGAARLMTQAAKASGYDQRLIWTDPLGICATLVIRSDEEAVHSSASHRRPRTRGGLRRMAESSGRSDDLEGHHAARRHRGLAAVGGRTGRRRFELWSSGSRSTMSSA